MKIKNVKKMSKNLDGKVANALCSAYLLLRGRKKIRI